MTKVNLITQTEYADLRGVSKVAVSKAVKAGRISLIDGKIDPVAADAQWARNSRVRAGSGHAAIQSEAAVSTGGSSDDYWAARARREVAEADIAEMKCSEMQGDLISTDAVRSALSKRAAGVRESLQQIPARLASVLAAESSSDKIHEILESEIHSALAQLASASQQLVDQVVS